MEFHTIDTALGMKMTAFNTEVGNWLIAQGYESAVLVPMGDMPRPDYLKEGLQIIPFLTEEEALTYFKGLDDETVWHSAVLDIERIISDLYEPSFEEQIQLFIEKMEEMG